MLISTCFAFYRNIQIYQCSHLTRKHCDKTIDIKSEAEKTKFYVKIFLILKVLLELTNFDANEVIEKTILNKITNRDLKEQSGKMIKAYTILL